MKRPKTKPVAVDIVRRLRDCAEERGMHCHDVVLFPARLRAAGIDPKLCTPSVVHHAQMLQRSIIDAVAERINNHNSLILQRQKEVNVSYRCEGCQSHVPAGTPRKVFNAMREPGRKQIEKEVPVCQRCLDWLACNRAGTDAERVRDLKAARAAEPKPRAAAKPVGVPLPPPVAPQAGAVEL